jgi:hypothetical protein
MMPLRGFLGPTFFVSCWRIIPFTMDLQRTTTDVATNCAPGTVFMIIRNIVPIFVIFNYFAAMPTRLLVPLRRCALSALLVNLGWVVPISMDLHRTAADLTALVVPGAMFVVLRHVTPVFVNMDVTTAVFT